MPIDTIINLSPNSPKGLLDGIFLKNEKYTFLVGSGISQPYPTCLPKTDVLINDFLDLLVPDEVKLDLNNSLNNRDFSKKQRFEMIIERVKDYLDKDLLFLDKFDEREPNLIHYFLAKAIIQGHYVVTTNFDCMIEKALKILLEFDKKDPNLIKPIITKDDFVKYSDPCLVSKSGKYPIYKIHGSKINYITKESTQESLVATMSDLGREFEEKMLSIKIHKKEAFKKLTEARNLVVIGYSGGDEFDISPTLVELNELSSIIWIQHLEPDNDPIRWDDIQFFTEKDCPNASIFPDNCKKLFRKLLRKAHDHKKKLRIYNINIETFPLVRELAAHFNESNDQPMIHNGESETKECIDQYNLKKIYDDKLTRSIKYDIACWIYFDLSDMTSTERCASKGSEEVKKTKSDLKYQLVFLKWLVSISRFNNRYYRAHKYSKEAIRICKKIRNNYEYSWFLNEIGRNYEKQGKFHKALGYYKQAFARISDNDIITFKILWDKSSSMKNAYLNNIANIHMEIRDFEAALIEFKEALQIAQEKEDFAGVSITQLNIATLNFQLAKSQTNKENALGECDEAIAAATKIGDLFLITRCIERKCSMLYQLEMYDLLETDWNELLTIYQLMNHYEGIANTCLGIGNMLFRQKSFPKAIYKYKEALKTFELLGNTFMQAESNHAIAGSYYSMQEFKLALQYEEAALKIAHTLKIPLENDYIKHRNVIKLALQNEEETLKIPLENDYIKHGNDMDELRISEHAWKTAIFVARIIEAVGAPCKLIDYVRKQAESCLSSDSASKKTFALYLLGIFFKKGAISIDSTRIRGILKDDQSESVRLAACDLLGAILTITGDTSCIVCESDLLTILDFRKKMLDRGPELRRYASSGVLDDINRLKPNELKDSEVTIDRLIAGIEGSNSERH